MAPLSHHLLPSLLLVFLFISTTIKAEAHDDDHRLVATVHVINAVPKNPEPMKINCKSRKIDLGSHEVGAGEDYRWNVEEKGLYYCVGIWGRKFASWRAFQPKRDENHDNVFWLVKENGFFLSWDNSTWVRKSVWESE